VSTALRADPVVGAAGANEATLNPADLLSSQRLSASAGASGRGSEVAHTRSTHVENGLSGWISSDSTPSIRLGSADVKSVTWELEATPVSSDFSDVRGPYISGPPSGRFVYLSWGIVEEAGTFQMFRRAKIMFDGIPTEAMTAARASGVLTGRLGLTDAKGNLICAAVRPPLIEWTATIR
jgi:hypothetical protein